MAKLFMSKAKVPTIVAAPTPEQLQAAMTDVERRPPIVPPPMTRTETADPALEAAVVYHFGDRQQRAAYLRDRGWRQTKSTGALEFEDPETPGGKSLDLVTALVRQVRRDLEPGHWKILERFHGTQR